MKSIFADKKIKPDDAALAKALGKTFTFWKTLVDFTKKSFPAAKEEWDFSSEKFGWSFRISDKKRVLIYLLPRDSFFKVAFVFGQKAMDKILESNISDEIKNELGLAKVYAEGRGIRIEIRDRKMMKDIEQLIKIKIES